MPLLHQTARRAPSIIHGGHFVDRDVTLATIRRQESARALGLLGVDATHSELPDGQLHNPEHLAALVDHIVDKARATTVHAIATLGINGFCGHDDHIATHIAARFAQQRIAKRDNVYIPILALNHRHEGVVVIPVDHSIKLSTLAIHQSQFGFLNDSADLPPTHAHYTPLLFRETYDPITI